MKQQFYFSMKDLGNLSRELLEKGYSQLPDVCPEGEMAEDKIIIDAQNKNFWYCDNQNFEPHIRIVANTHQQTIEHLKDRSKL
ncbi:hypothetical protein [Flagellimonas nanhaiensis]|uniref:Uncharacterized protein n=1 Tax=Flagellimonas nanhaiensis TaxID=2292706 RepID=A0A371JNW2_9FLAO|nr:hypothetical protein [Allomuricauda nanhaiensis]RDY58905.1 hypothetical protein DX873_14700 [Allomuricauda nanhaiensis]